MYASSKSGARFLQIISSQSCSLSSALRRYINVCIIIIIIIIIITYWKLVNFLTKFLIYKKS